MPTADEIFADAPLLADGAMGTVLLARGGLADGSVEALNRTRPEDVAELHAAYVAAGAQVLCTNTFAANRFRLAVHRRDGELQEINRAGVELARRSAAEAHHRVWVAGDVGPLGVQVAPYGRVQPAQAFDAFAEQIEVLAAAGADLLLLETFADLRQILEAVRAARQVSALPVIATMTFTRDDRTLLGETPAQVAAALIAARADAVGVNCAGGPAQAMRVLRALRAAAPEVRLAVKPNAGWPEQVGGRLVYRATPEYFGRYAVELAAAGASLVGGCCGTTPEHIAAMRQALAEASASGPSVGRAVPGPPRDMRSSSPTPNVPRRAGDGPPDSVGEVGLDSARGDFAKAPNRFADKIRAPGLAVTVEMSPPKGLNVQALLAGARLLKEAGADAINVADSPRARMRMSPWAAAHLIQREVGLDTVLHFPLRGRNLLRVQGDLLAAHALGIRNLFAVLGDPTAIGDHPGAMDSYDLVPSGLIRLVKQNLNAGIDQAGAGIGEPTAFTIGCALNLAAGDVDKEIRALRKKLDAGADFVLTQPVYAGDTARAFLERYEEVHGRLDRPLIAGILPLFGERHATFLHNEVPGISIGADLRARVAEGGRDEGVRIAVEIVRDLEPTVQGIYLMPPFAKWDIAAEVIEAIADLMKSPPPA